MDDSKTLYLKKSVSSSGVYCLLIFILLVFSIPPVFSADAQSDSDHDTSDNKLETKLAFEKVVPGVIINFINLVVQDENTIASIKSNKKDAKPLDVSEFDWGDALMADVISSGGWFNFISGGPMTDIAMTLGSWFGEDWGWKGSAAFDFAQYLTINYWAEDICANRADKLSNAGDRAFITSDSGRTFAHMEGERSFIDPCLGETFAEACRPYYSYKISGEVGAGEIPMRFNVYLVRENGEPYDIYEGQTISLEKGQKLSLSGADMWIFENYTRYDRICIDFKNTGDLEVVFGAQFRPGFGDNPLCQDIVDALARDYQQFETETAKLPRPGTPKPSTEIHNPSGEGSSEGNGATRPGFSGE